MRVWIVLAVVMCVIGLSTPAEARVVSKSRVTVQAGGRHNRMVVSGVQAAACGCEPGTCTCGTSSKAVVIERSRGRH